MVLYAHQLFQCKVIASRPLSMRTGLPGLSRSVLTPNQMRTLALREDSRRAPGARCAIRVLQSARHRRRLQFASDPFYIVFSARVSRVETP